MKATSALTALFLVLALAPGESHARDREPKGPTGTFRTDVPEHPLDLILARPTRNSATLSVLAHQDMTGRVAYGTQRGSYPHATPKQSFRKGQPTEVLIGGLEPNTRYTYRFQAEGATDGAEGTFHTQRPPGSPFTFTVTADSHLDENTNTPVYRQTLANALADAPDFHIDLGDTFMTGKHPDRDSAAKQYLAQRYYFGLVAHSAPLFLVLGNHDGEVAPQGRRDDAALAVWANTMRKTYFPNPVPDGFYSGNAAKHPSAGLLQDYYAWEWGDALFVVLDPFWYSAGTRDDEGWRRTLGRDQYQWLKSTLEASKAAFRFVFIHHLVGGATKDGRGGIEAAKLFKWGGRNADGSDGFGTRRPGWPTPIHQLLVQNRVNVVFHGHDHLFAKEELDGIVYQTVPQPGSQGRDGAPRFAADYGYRSGVILGGAGHLRVAVSGNGATVEFVRSRLDAAGGANRQVAHSYAVPQTR